MTPFWIFVVALGVWMLASAMLNWDWFYGVIEFAAAEALLGENAARWLCGACGLITIVIGVAGWLSG